MFHSIRWRLTLSYVLVTLVTVAVVGVLGIALVLRYVENQEMGSLRGNAEAIARQALPMLWPRTSPRALQELAATTAFMGNLRVKVFDSEMNLVADSGGRYGNERFVWVLPPDGVGRIVFMRRPFDPLFMELTPPVDASSFGLEGLPPGTSFTLVRRSESLWGDRVQFEASIEELVEGEDGLRSALTDGGNPPERDGAGPPPHLLRVPVMRADTPVGYVELRGRSILDDRALRTVWGGLLAAGLGAGFIAVVVGLVVSRGLTMPLEGLAQTTERMSAGDLSVRASIERADEFGGLARGFNRMADRLETTFADLERERDILKRFVADASHELRTPITALKNFNELMQGPAADDDVARAEFLEESQGQIERLEWLTHKLLDLSRLDAGLVDLEVVPVNLEDLLNAVGGVFESRAADKKIALSVRAPANPVELECDRTWVEVALGNLLENALKFTPPGGRIELGGDGTGQEVKVWVQDSGPGVAAADRPLIFQRFFRGRNAAGSGSGLGLAIAQSVMHAHDGSVALEDGDHNEGARFTLVFPR